MRPGDVLAGRFELERRAGAGGMGEVFRARDLASGEAVAVKVLLDRRSGEDRRFAREATVLSELRHPGIVRYVAHGLTDAGEPYLAMEWLQGEDLSCRLGRSELTVDETLALVTGVAVALAAAHARGVVHRDLKPSNLFLVDGEVARVKVLDFGIAHLGEAPTMTKTGIVLGTPGYMAPEQARGDRDVDARADVFALGCVLFKCLTGRPAFTGEHVMAVLAKILLDDVPRVRELRPDVAPALDALCARMLARDRDERPSDGAAVAEALYRLGMAATLPIAARRHSGEISSALTRKERRMLSVILIGRGPIPGGVEMTLPDAKVAARDAVCREAEAHGGGAELLADGSVAVTVTGARVATDQAALAARCALGLRKHARGWSMALATGRGELTGRVLFGEAIDRAATMLATRAPTAASPTLIAIDEVTAGLLDARFDVRESDDGLSLCGERELAEGTRTLLGKTTACVGRDWEIGTLEQLFNECVEDATARAVLVTAPAGMGKSRLAYEFARRVQQRGEEIALWSGRVDSLQAGSAFGLLGQVLRGALGIQGGEPIEVRQEKLRARVLQHGAAGQHRRVAEFLGELVGTPFPDEMSVPLRAARRDAQIMSDQMNLAFIDFLRAETSAHPVLIVLEDLHWGDLPTVRIIDAALRELRSQPWMVLALARPEVHELFPGLWADRSIQQIRLKELTRKASERLVRQVLGDAVDTATMERLVTLADGHAFYLEELIRTVAEGRRGALPETVLSMVEARLSVFESEARRVLRAASVFGEVCWQSGVESLLGGAASATQVGNLLKTLVAREVLVRMPESRFPGDAEFAFRHALLREGVYAMLTAEDRTLGHRLAGTWLESTSFTDALIMAEHFSRGGEPVRAVRWYRHAAEQALAADDLPAVLERVERGVACGAEGEELGALRLCEAEAHSWRGELSLAEQRGVEATGLLAPNTAAWFHAVHQAGSAAGKLGEFDRTERWAEQAIAAVPEPHAVNARLICLSDCAAYLIFGGRYAVADVLIAAIEAAEGPDAQAAAMREQTRAFRASAAGDYNRCLDRLNAALAAFEQAGDRRNACTERANIGFILAELGEFSGAEEVLRAALTDADRIGLHEMSATALHNLGLVLAYRGNLDEARRLEHQAIDAFLQQGSPRLIGLARTYLAKIELLADDVAAAEREALAAAEALLAAPPLRAAAVAVLALAQIAQGSIAEALAAAREAYSLLESLGSLEEGEALVRLAYAEALLAAGEERAFAETITTARARLLDRAARISDPVWRERFLTQVPDNARTLSLAARAGEVAPLEKAV